MGFAERIKVQISTTARSRRDEGGRLSSQLGKIRGSVYVAALRSLAIRFPLAFIDGERERVER